MSSSGPQQQPGPGGGPPDNPIVKWYTEWSGRTPLVTRRTLQMIVALWLVTLFLDVSLFIVNIPFYTVLHFEVYRLLLSPLYTPGFLSVLFICLTLSQMATRLESLLGSTALAYLMGLIALLTNLTFTLACLLLWACGMTQALFFQAESFWLVVMGLIAIECVQGGGPPTRQLFMIPIQIPSVYFPLVLWGLFSLFTGPRLDMFCALAVGYLYGLGWLKKLEPSDRTLNRWESSSLLASVVAKPGYITASSVRSDQPWVPLSGGDAGAAPSSTTFNPMMGAARPSAPTSGFPSSGGTTLGGGAGEAAAGFPGQGGHTLGGAKPSNARDLAAARAAKLQGHQGGGAQAAPSESEREDDPFLARHGSGDAV